MFSDPFGSATNTPAHRGVRSFRIEGAKESLGDGLNWVELLHYDAGEGNMIPQGQCKAVKRLLAIKMAN